MHTPARTCQRAVLGALVVALALSGCGGAHRPVRRHATPAPAPRVHNRGPNIVFVLTDDLSSDLVRYMPAVKALAAHGTTFTNYFVTDSLCCPSRASLLTGDYPHDTGIFTNDLPDGGFTLFHALGEERRSFNLALQRAGYRTALMGKYLNGYLPPDASGTVPDSYVPPGWHDWDGVGFGYPEYDYALNHNGTVEQFGHRPDDYLTTVLARRGAAFIDAAARSPQPFFLELATFAPHEPYTPAPRYARAFPGLTAPRPPNFDVLPTHAPQWLARQPPLTPAQLQVIDQAFRRRVQAVQSIDDMLTAVERALRAHHLLRRTLIVFSSDNGLHTGEYRLLPGKLTAFDTDIRVPLIVAGPSIAHRRTSAVAENVDLAETFAAFAGTRVGGDGHNLAALLRGGKVARWRDVALIEHHGPDYARSNPDLQSPAMGDPTTYEAMRTPAFLYVEYSDGERELYRLRRDRFELHNVIGRLPAARVGRLHRELGALERCHSAAACWAASHVDLTP